MATLRWVDRFDNRGLFGPVGHIRPGQDEANYYAAIDALDDRLTQMNLPPKMFGTILPLTSPTIISAKSLHAHSS